MSAWIVSREHIDVLVTALEPESQGKGDEIGRMLWRECLTSVAYRYPRDRDGERPGPVDFRDADVTTYTWTKRVVPGCWVYKAAACYSYQSCEHPGWESSQAKHLTDHLLRKYHPHKDTDTSYGRPNGPDNPPWGITADNLRELAANS